MKHLKSLGLLAVAIMALSAWIGVSSASAEKFTAGKVGAKLIEETKVKPVLTITGSKVECSEINFEGTTEALEASELRVIPTTGGCTAFGFAAATHHEINCKWFLRRTWRRRSQDTIKPCKTTVVVENAFATCEVVINEQEIENALSFTNSGTGHITVIFNTSGIAAEVTKSTGLCPLTVGKHVNASYTGESTLKAEGTTLSWDP